MVHIDKHVRVFDMDLIHIHSNYFFLLHALLPHVPQMAFICVQGNHMYAKISQGYVQHFIINKNHRHTLRKSMQGASNETEAHLRTTHLYRGGNTKFSNRIMERVRSPHSTLETCTVRSDPSTFQIVALPKLAASLIRNN
jgi:hypothetical protein